MALKKCRECQVLVSDSAKVCPHCGIKNPGKASRGKFWGGVLIAAFVIGSVSKGFKGPDVSTENAVLRPECQVKKANGEMDPRACDLVELCKDRTFYEKKVSEAKTADELVEARGALGDVMMWLSAYKVEDQIAVCSGTYGKKTPLVKEVNKNAKVESQEIEVVAKKSVKTFPCSSEPSKYFPVGKIYSAEEFFSLIGGNCPGAQLDQDGEASLSWGGRVYTLVAQAFSSGSGGGKYMVSSVRVE